MNKEDFEKFLKSPTLFAMQVLKIKPFKYQAKILEDDSKSIIIVGGRNIGKTTTISIKSLWNAFVKPNYEVLIVAPTLRQSRIVYEAIRRMIKANKFIYNRAYITMHETKFDNDSIIRIVPVGEKGNIARGFHPNMLLFDEVAFMPDEAVLSIEPSIIPKDGTIIYSSTPYGMHNRFYELYRMHRDDWSVYQIPSWECPLVKEKYLEAIRPTMPEAFFMQEYGAKFISEIGMLYPYNLILKNAKDYSYEEMSKTDTIMGVDVSAGGTDENAIVIVRNDDGIWRVVWTKAIAKMPFSEFANYIIGVAERFNTKQINIERNGVGEGLYQSLLEKAISGIDINGFYAVGKERLNMYFHVKGLLESEKLVLNKNDRKLIMQSSNYEVKENANGELRVLKGNGHDDLWDSLVYALYEKDLRVGIVSRFDEVI